jgi:hypothetical protein
MRRSFMRFLPVCCWQGALLAQDSGVPVNASNVKDLTELSAKYGPFAFAIIFLMFAAWLTREAIKSKQKILWVIVCAVFTASIIFAVFGVHHWNEVNTSAQVFEGQILDLYAYEDVFPWVPTDEVYFKVVPGQVVQEETDPPHSVDFAVIKKTPFVNGEEIQIGYKKRDQNKRRAVTLKYDSSGPSRYTVTYDSASDTVKLQNSNSHTAGRFPSPLAAYAQAPPAPKAGAAAPQAQVKVSSVNTGLIDLLQDPRTPVGKKIDALDSLRQMDPATLGAYADKVTRQEPFALTLIDLTRHSDPELASKANTVVQKSGAESALAHQLSSSNAHVRSSAEQAVLRVSPQRAQAILKQAPSSATTQALTAQVASGAKQQVLVPVGSNEGDRYYVDAKWQSSNAKTALCLAEVFNREIPSSRSLQDEQKLMQGRSERLVYWYSKEWALGMADKIKACGGTASFPNPLAKK